MSRSNCLPIELYFVVMCRPSFILRTYDSEECGCYFLDGKIVLCSLVTCALLSKQQPSPLWLPGLLQPLNRLPLLLLVDYPHVTSILMLVFPPLFVQMVERGSALLRKMEISVAEAEKRTGKNTVNMQETYTVYLIEIRLVWRHRICSAAQVCHLIVLFLKLKKNASGLIYNVCRPAESVVEGATPAAPDTLWRRYSEFELLRTYLLVTYPYIIIPPLPEKRVRKFSVNINVYTLGIKGSVRKKNILKNFKKSLKKRF